MAAITTLRFTNPFPSRQALLSTKLHNPRPFTLRATDVQSTEDDTKPEPETPRTESDPEPDQFESRLSEVRLRYRSGKGKKAEVRKSKKGSTTGTVTGRSASGMYLPPVALKEAVSGGLKVEFGFSRYSERLNGRIAGLGLTALLLVELATGKSVLNYHTPAIVLIQLYFVAAVSALCIKYEKEKVSVWPKD